MRFAHLSDIHFGGENPEATQAAADHVNAAGVDLTVISGDLTRYGEEPEFDAAVRWLQGLTAPVLITPGNHDAPYIAWMERLTSPFRRFERAIGPARRQLWASGEAVVVGVNTARGVQPRLNWSKGRIARVQVSDAVQILAGSPAPLRMVVVHHPLTEMLGGPMTARVWGGEDAARRLAEARVDLVLSGHIHAPFVWPYPWGDGRTYAAGAGTLSVRERGTPPGFNMVDVERAAIRIAALAWTGSHFEPYRTWSLERRP